MKKILKKNLWFLIPYIIFLSGSLAIILAFPKAEIHLFSNTNTNSFLDFFFKYWTHTGHGVFAVFVSVFLLFLKYRWAIISAISNIAIGIVVQSLKRLVFTDSFRPVLWFKTNFENTFNLYLVEGAEPGWYYSFPSGHTATAFGIFFLLSIISKKSIYKFIFFLCAFLAAYSRIYLSWHFLEDAVFGSLIGLVISFLFYMLFVSKKETKLDGSLLKSIKKSDK